MIYSREITIDVNSNIFEEFFKTCEYLHKIKRLNCFYDKSIPFQFIINNFNEDYKNDLISIENLQIYNTEHIKKDIQIGFSIDKGDYQLFCTNAKNLHIKPRPLIRILMYKTIKNKDNY
jgi:hypothetical protein